MIFLKTPEEIKIMHEANRMLHCILDDIEPHIKAGNSTQLLDDIASEGCLKFHVRPAFLGYRNFPKSLCVSVNAAIVHGIPSDTEILQNGDVVSIDFGIEYKNFFADAARTLIVGQAPENKIKLVMETKRALDAGVSEVKVGNMLQDISKAIEAVAKENRYGNIKKMCGHGVGRALHEEPQVINYTDTRAPNIRLQEGLVLAIEPMFTLGTSDIKIMGDGWKAITADNSTAAHWEYSVAIVDGEPLILGK